ncbi:MAG: hypothetical protein KAH22_03035 [Thiotrichaceae bacterium]|nr:hypothetical protein [Thiotrichaceae bacterium]
MTDKIEKTAALTLSYQQPSEFYADHLHLFSHLQRDDVSFNATVNDAVAFREAMASLFAIVSSDYRYAPKDRTQYAAYMQMKNSHRNQGLAKAHYAYYDWLLKNDPEAWLILDPVISVHPDKVTLEVFSKDEGCYAALSFDHDFFKVDGKVGFGTTNIDFSAELATGVEQIRSFHETQFSIGQQSVTFKTATAVDLEDTEVIEKKIKVPQSWIRGFLQVQSSAQLTADTFELNPIDLYNCLHYLRMNADVKGQRRGLRVELVPSLAPRLVLEPDDVVIEGSAGSYQGKQAKVIRLWGRRRLALLKRFLPFAEKIEVSLLGNGMPSFWILQGKGMSLTLAVTGFTASNWSQSLSFDLLLPRKAEALDTLTTVSKYLEKHFVASLAAIVKATKATKVEVVAALQQGCQQGLVSYDIAHQVYRYRPLMEEPLDMAEFQYRLPVEALAYDLVARQKAIGELSLKVIANEGTEISAEIKVKEDKREYLTRLKLNEEGHVARAECSCHQIMQKGLSQGPCSHLVALRLHYAAYLASRDVKLITQETRFYSRRKKSLQSTVQVTLNNKRLLLSRDDQQQQQFAFNSVQEARQAYLGQVSQLEINGYIEG